MNAPEIDEEQFEEWTELAREQDEGSGWQLHVVKELKKARAQLAEALTSRQACRDALCFWGLVLGYEPGRNLNEMVYWTLDIVRASMPPMLLAAVSRADAMERERDEARAELTFSRESVCDMLDATDCENSNVGCETCGEAASQATDGYYWCDDHAPADAVDLPRAPIVRWMQEQAKK